MKHPPPDTHRIVSCLERMRAGERSAFAELIDLTQAHIFRFCLYLCGNKEQAEDLVQETLLKSFDSLSDLREPEKLMGWLLRIARNLFLNQRTRAKKYTGHLNPEEMESIPSGESEPDRRELNDLVQSTLATLESEDRVVLVLVGFEGHSYREASEITGSSETALRSRFMRARRKFMERLEGEKKAS